MRRVLEPLWLAVLLTVPLWLQDQYLLHIVLTTGIFIIAAMSLNLLLGYAGQLSLGHVAFFGIGAYASALASLGFDVELLGGLHVIHQPWPAVAGFLVSAIAGGLSGYLIGRLSFKVRGAYFVIVSISFAEVTRLVALNWVELTQGPLALTNIPAVTFGFPGLGYTTLWSKTAYFYLVAAIGIVAYLAISRLVSSRIGRAMIALKENEQLAGSVGIDVAHHLVLAATISAAIAGSAGALYAHYLRIIDPDIFLFINTVIMVIMVITGGKGTLAGPIVGGIIFGFLPVIVRPFAAPAVQWILYGCLMIVILFILPEGIVPAVERWIATLDRAEAKRRHAGVAQQAQVVNLEMPPTPPAARSTVLSIQHVAARFGGVVALSDLSLTVSEGEIVGLIGPNGAGKTTAFNVITGYLRPTHGEIHYRGALLNGRKPHEIAALGLVRTFQRTSIFANSTVFDNVLIGLHRRGRSTLWGTLLALPRENATERELRKQAQTILLTVGLAHRAQDLAATLTFGEQRLLGIALALAATPSMLLLDEPVSGMNPSETGQVMELVKNIRACGVTILLVEHDMRMVMQVSDRILVLNQGGIIAAGPPAVIRDDPEVIRAYLGEGRRRA